MYSALLSLAMQFAAFAPVPQDTIRGIVSHRGSNAIIAGGRVELRRAGRVTYTDSTGRFSFPGAGAPDTVVVSAPGFLPDSVPVTTGRSLWFAVTLRPVALLAELTVLAPAPQVAVAAGPGQWSLGQRAIRAAPAFVEADPFRALALVPAVGFSSVLSARPMVRGYEANLTALRVDGFEMRNLYRLGRVLSSFPADAVGRITVTTPPRHTTTSALAGVVDIEGRRERVAGASLSFGSLGAYAGKAGNRVGGFAATRLLHASALRLTGIDFPIYYFDQYARVDLGGSEPRASISAFLTADRYGEPGDTIGSAAWHSALLGGRLFLFKTPSTSVEIETSWVRFDQRVERGPTQRVEVNVGTRIDHVRSAFAVYHSIGAAKLSAGLGANWRGVDNRIEAAPSADGSIPQSPSYELTPYSLVLRRWEADGFGAVQFAPRRLDVEIGARFQRGGGLLLVSPWLRVKSDLSRQAVVAMVLTRARSLHQYVSDPASEPDYAYYDYWLPAQADTVGAAGIAHGALDLKWAQGPLAVRIGVFASRGTGLSDIRPPTVQRTASRGDIRIGRSRTVGVEAQVSLSPPSRPDRVASISYVLSRSERNWGQSWVPWGLDRRHQARVQLATEIERRWRVDLLIDFTSGVPYTPVAGRINSNQLAPRFPYQNPAVFGSENAARDAGRTRLDAGVTHNFTGPWNSRMFWGISVLNLNFGALPLRLSGDAHGAPPGYERPGFLPPVPTLTLRIEF